MSFVTKSVYLVEQWTKAFPIPLSLQKLGTIAKLFYAHIAMLARQEQFYHDTQQKESFMRSLESYTILGLLSSLYAVGLNTKVGKKFTEEYTWATVCIGTSLVLAVLRLMIPKEYWLKLMTAFTVAGFPMVARSLYNKTIREIQHNEARP